MAQHVLPAGVQEYLDGDANAIANHLQFIAEHRGAEATRAYAEDAARAVGRAFCSHEEPPPALPTDSTVKERRALAGEHAGACGRHQAGVIAGVSVAAIIERGVQPSANKLRNQACFDAAVTLNARGKGVQLRRPECFGKACQALWPGDHPVSEEIRAAFW